MRSTRVNQLVCGLLVCLSFNSYVQGYTPEIPEAVGDFWVKWNEFISDITESSLDTDPDPWEPLNRKIFAFNEGADQYVLTPLAKGYQWVTPDPVETGIGNMFSNLLEVTTIFNDLLQFKFGQAASDTGRFLVNTTVGLVGFFDVATTIGLEKHHEDLGQTLGYWGVGSGPYLVVPLLGSYTLRSGVGGIGDVYTDYVGKIEHVPTRNQLWVTRTLDRRARLFAAEALITGDRYLFIRNAFLQRREYLLNDGVIEDSFGDEDFDEEWGDEEDLAE
ncbi:MAG: VacJ family lipoprotein [Pseudomonadales bacterium]